MGRGGERQRGEKGAEVEARDIGETQGRDIGERRREETEGRDREEGRDSETDPVASSAKAGCMK